MKHLQLILLVLVTLFAHDSSAKRNTSDLDAYMVQAQSGQVSSPVDINLLMGMALLHEIDIKKLKIEEDGRHLVFHFDRIRKMKKGCKFCCSLCKLFLCLIHLCLLLMIFTHLFH